MRVFKKQSNARKFTIELRDHHRIVRRFAGLADRRQSEQLGRRIEDLIGFRAAKQLPDRETAAWLEHAPAGLKERLAKLGIIDAARVTATKPLVDRIAKTVGREAKQREKEARRKRGESLLADFSNHLQAVGRTPKYIDENDAMLRRIFKVCRFALFSDIAPGKVERFLKVLRDDGLSVRRSNGYLVALKVFCNWMVDTGQATESPVRSLRKLNEKTDVRRQRRAATPDELRKLIAGTAEGPEAFGMSGAERALLYRFCAETGLRANEARTLTAGAFDLDALTVTVKAGYSKHRETDTVPLREDLAEALRDHLNGKLPAAKVFGGRYVRLTDRTADMLKADLEAVGLPYEDDQGRVLDFHATRHTFITGLGHAPSRVAQKLARHKSSAMTDRYTHIRMHDERAALDLLPDLTAPADDAAEQKRTGTDDRPADAIGQTKNTGSDIQNSGARHGALWGAKGGKTLEAGAKENRVPGIGNAVLERGRRDSNPQPSDRQSDALTN